MKVFQIALLLWGALIYQTNGSAQGLEGAYRGVLLPVLKSDFALRELSKALKPNSKNKLYLYPDVVVGRDFGPGSPALLGKDFFKAWTVREYSINLLILL